MLLRVCKTPCSCLFWIKESPLIPRLRYSIPQTQTLETIFRGDHSVERSDSIFADPQTCGASFDLAPPVLTYLISCCCETARCSWTERPCSLEPCMRATGSFSTLTSSGDKALTDIRTTMYVGEEEAGSAYVCRICFEECDELEHSGLISPCNCKGSHSFVSEGPSTRSHNFWSIWTLFTLLSCEPGPRLRERLSGFRSTIELSVHHQGVQSFS